MSDAFVEAVVAAIATVLRDTGRSGTHAVPTSLLADDLGLDSLDLAQTIVLLERSLGVDPFRSAGPVTRPIRTVADLASVYAEAVPGFRE